MLDAEGKQVDDKGLKSLMVEMSNGKKFELKFKPHPPPRQGPPTDFFWSGLLGDPGGRADRIVHLQGHRNRYGGQGSRSGSRSRSWPPSSRSSPATRQWRRERSRTAERSCCADIHRSRFRLALCSRSRLLLSHPLTAAPKAAALGPEVALSTPRDGYVGRLDVTPLHGPVGTQVTVTGDKLPANQEFQLVWRTVKGKLEGR